MGPLVFLLVLLMIAGVYFLPTIIALLRGKRNAFAIAMLNLFLGWTFVGWVVALVWSVANESIDER